MLEVIVKSQTWDQSANGGEGRFGEKIWGTLQLEHSLISIAKWEEKWHIPFLSSKNKTGEQMLDYIRCMTVNKQIDPDIYTRLNEANVKEIQAYIEDPHTATHFVNSWLDEVRAQQASQNPYKKDEPITAELIYYWMIANNIPVDICQKWHVQRLLALIRVCAIKNTPKDKKNANKFGRLSSGEQQAALAKRNALNAQRRAQLGTTG